jgi:hypothetical protein
MLVSSPALSTSSVSPDQRQQRRNPMKRSSGSSMNRSARKNTELGGIDHHVWRRLFRSRHPVKTADAVAADLGAPLRTVENWISGVSAPSLGWFVRIVDAYGPQVLADVMPDSCGWLSAAVRSERRAQLEAEQRRIEHEMQALDDAHARASRP